MGLVLKLSKVGLSADGTTLTVQDTTGEYDAETNPGGYGEPNPEPSTMLQMRWSLWASCLWTLIQGDYVSADIQAGFAITTINTLLSTGLNLLPDGVEQVQMLMGYAMDVDNNLAVINGSCTATLTGFIPSDFTGIRYISFVSLPDEIFEILNIVGNTVYLDHPYDGDNTTELVNQWYNVDLQILVQTAGNNNINQQLARVTAGSLKGDKLIELTSQTMDSFAASARFDAGDYQGANNLALSVANYQYYRRYGS